jgi:V/A-type H+-transporting ATPase subunit E
VAHTLESFIDTLRTDGVEAGQKAAEEIRREAEKEAEQSTRDAEAKAKQIVEAAEEQRRQTLARTQTDLDLAARDTVTRLHEALSQAITRILTQAVTKKLEDSDFLAGLIQDIATQYAQADAVGNDTITVNVSAPMRQKLTHWAIETFHKPAEKLKPSVELHGALSTAGFEYRVSGGTIEMTPESVVQVLSEIVTPELRKLLAPAKDETSSKTET